MARTARRFRPANTRKGVRGYVDDRGAIRHSKSRKLGTHRRRAGRPRHVMVGPLGLTLPTLRRKRRRGLFGLF